MTRPLFPFIDWMKAVGLALIVWVHVAGGTAQSWTPPFYAKQLGVTFFVFVTGYTLAHERRRRAWVVAHRHFDVFVWGLLCALVMAAIGLATRGRPDPSNFLPLAGGAHIVMNNFPANPTTWYIGTYLHLLVLWAVALRGRRITWPLLLLVTLGEIGVRALLAPTLGLFVAYMLVTNWLAVLLLGLLAGQRGWLPSARGLGPAALFVLLWPLAMSVAPWQRTFPFMTLPGLPTATSALLLSLAVSVAYLAYTASAFTLLGRLPANAVVQFLSRNTTIVFIAHMPVYYLLEWVLRPLLPAYGPRVSLEFLLCFAGLAVVSDGLRRVVDIGALRTRLEARL